MKDPLRYDFKCNNCNRSFWNTQYTSPCPYCGSILMTCVSTTKLTPENIWKKTEDILEEEVVDDTKSMNKRKKTPKINAGSKFINACPKFINTCPKFSLHFGLEGGKNAYPNLNLNKTMQIFIDDKLVVEGNIYRFAAWLCQQLHDQCGFTYIDTPTPSKKGDVKDEK